MVAGSPVPGLHFPLTKVSLCLKCVCLLPFFASMINGPDNIALELWNITKHRPAPGGDHESPRCYSYPVNCWPLTILYSPTCVSKVPVCLFYFLIQSQRYSPPHFAFSRLLIHHQCISCNPLTASPLVPMYKISGKRPFSGAFSQSSEILLPSNCHQFGSNKLIKTLTALDSFYVHRSLNNIKELFILLSGIMALGLRKHMA